MGPLQILRHSPAWVDKATRAQYKRMLGTVSLENQRLMEQIQDLMAKGLSEDDARVMALAKQQRPKGLQESNLFTAHMAGVQHMDPDAELLLAPMLNTKDKAAASMIFRPGYHDGEKGILPGSIYIEGLASEVPGGGTQLLKQLESEYPGHPMHLESMRYPETLDFYEKKGFQRVDRNGRGLNLIGGDAPFFVKDPSVQIKAKGGHVKNPDLQLTMASPRDVEFGRIADAITAERAKALPSNMMARRRDIGPSPKLSDGRNFITPEQRTEDFEQRLEKGMITSPALAAAGALGGAYAGPLARLAIEGTRSVPALAAMAGIGAGMEQLEDNPTVLGTAANAAKWAAMGRLPISEVLGYVGDAEAAKFPFLTKEGIGRLIENYAYTMAPQASKAAIGRVSARDFLNATTPGPESLERILKETKGKYDPYWEGRAQHPTLYLGDEGQIVGHEGRHRIAGLSQAMGENVEVPVVFKNYNRTQPDEFDALPRMMAGQKFGRNGDAGIGFPFPKGKLTPVSYANEEALQKYLTEFDVPLNKVAVGLPGDMSEVPLNVEPGYAGGGQVIRTASDLAKHYPNLTSAQRLRDYTLSRLPNDLRSRGPLSSMSSGSGRIPFGLGDDLVVKTARMPRGIQENILEGDWVAPVPEAVWKSDDDSIAVVKRGKPMTRKNNPEEMQKVWSLEDAIRKAQFNSSLPYTERVKSSPKVQELLDDLEWGALLNYDPLWGDIAKRNVGMMDSKPILLDAGILSRDILNPERTAETISPAEWQAYRRDVLNSKQRAEGGPVNIAPSGARHGSLGVKGKGYFGELSGKHGRSTEISTEDESGEYPLMVPTLSADELSSLLAGEKPSPEMYSKARAHADKRRATGASPFADSVGLHYPDPRFAHGGPVNKIQTPEHFQAIINAIMEQGAPCAC